MEMPKGSTPLLPCVMKGRLVLGPGWACCCNCCCRRVPMTPLGESSERLLAAALRSLATPRLRLIGAGAGTGTCGLHIESSSSSSSSLLDCSCVDSCPSFSCPLVCASFTSSAKAFGIPALIPVINLALRSKTSKPS